MHPPSRALLTAPVAGKDAVSAIQIAYRPIM